MKPWARAAVVFAVALALRLPGIEDRPLHADEAVQAARLEDRGRYTARDFHGPVLQYLTPTTWQSATERSLRLVPAVAGALLAAFPGGSAPLCSGLLIALSPAMRFYSRDYIPEMLLVLWTALLLRWPRAAISGALAGLMLATKETAVLALGPALLVWRRKVNVLTCLSAVVLLLGPWGLGELLRGYWTVWLPRAAGDTKHIHGPLFYGELLLRTEWPIVLLAIVAAWKHRRLAVYTALVLGLYSAIPYKTPWCALTALHGLALLAGAGLGDAAQALPRFRAFAWLPAAATCLVLGVIGAEPTWLYSETSAGVRRLAGLDLPADARVQVLSRENVWPLPFYLRRFSRTTYAAAPGASPPADLIVYTPEVEPELLRALYETPPPGRRRLYRPVFDEPVFLRPGLELRAVRVTSP